MPTTPHRLRALFALGAALVSASCAGSPEGTVALTFGFEGAPPAAGTALFAHVEVQARPNAALPGPVLASSDAVFTVGAPLALPGLSVPNGVDRRVVVELRASASPEARVRFYGVSEPFAVAAGEDRVAAVAVPLRAPLAEVGNSLSVTFDSGATTPGPRDLEAATLRVESRGAREIQLANNATFNSATTLDATTPGCAPGDGDPPALVCTVGGWDLRAASDAEGAVYEVFARFVDAFGYPSDVVSARVRVDLEAPRVLHSALAPAIARPGDDVVISVTVDEPTRVPTLSASPALPGLAAAAPTLDGTTWRWLAHVPEDAPDGASYEFEVTLTDLAGNPEVPTSQPLRAAGLNGNLGPLLSLTVDADAPVITVTGLSRSRDGATEALSGSPLYARAGDVVTASFVASDTLSLAPPFRASLGDQPLACVRAADATATREPWECTVTIASGDRLAELTARVFDRAGQEALVRAATLAVDDTAPTVLGDVAIARDDGYLPATAVAGVVYLDGAAELLLRAVLSEPLGAPPTLIVGEEHVEGTAADGLFASFTVKSVASDGRREMRLELVDRAGNVGSVALPDLAVDTVAPVLTDAAASVFLHHRAPWGEVASAGVPSAELRVCPGPPAWDDCPTDAALPEEVARLRVHTYAAGCTSTVRAERDLVPGTFVTLDPSEGAFCVSVIDRAGNGSLPVVVRRGEWVGTLRGKVAGSDAVNPLDVEAWPHDDGTLDNVDARPADAAQGLASVGGLSLSTASAGTWHLVTSEVAEEDVARAGAALVWDASRGEAVLGPGCSRGEISGCSRRNPSDPLRWNGVRWLASPLVDDRADDAPAPRYGYGFVWDTRLGVALMTGGVDTNFRVAQQSWRWDGREWSVGPSLGLAARASMAITHVGGAGHSWIFGGCEVATCDGVDPMSDLWRVDGDRADPFGSASTGAPPWPTGRSRSAMAYDVARGELVMFGGMRSWDSTCDSSADESCDGTWIWDGAHWRVVSPSDLDGHAPGATPSPLMVYDARREVVVMWGCNVGCTSAQTWEWDGDTWTLVDAGGPLSPPPAVEGAMAYDVARGETLLLPGLVDGWSDPDEFVYHQSTGALWSWDGESWRRAAGNAVDDVDKAPLDGPAPISVRRASVAPSASGDGVWVFGGADDDGVAFGDALFRWDGVSWTQAAPGGAPGAPTPRIDAAIAHNGGALYVFGGRPNEASLAAMGDFYRFEGGVWTALTAPDTPAARFQATLTPSGPGKLLLMGGGSPAEADGVCPPETFSDFYDFPCARRDTWIYDIGAGTWARVVSEPTPRVRYGHAIAYDPLRKVSVLFGGHRPETLPPFGAGCFEGVRDGALDCLSTDLWEADRDGLWTKITPTDPESDGDPAPRYDHALVWSAELRAVLLIGGFSRSSGCDNSGVQACTVAWAWNGTSWRRLGTTEGAEAPHRGLGDVRYAALKPVGQAERIDAFAPAPIASRRPTSALHVHAFTPSTRARPAHVLRVSASDVVAGGEFEARSVSVRWDGGGTGGAELATWRGLAWEPLATTTGTPTAPATLSWSSATREEAADLFVAPPAGGLALSWRPAAGGTASIISDYIELRVHYTLSSP